MADIILPVLVELTDHGGDVEEFIDEVHKIYLKVFTPPILIKNKKILPVIYPLQCNGRHFSFAHVTSRGKREEDREWDLARSGRIGWLRPILSDIQNPCLKVFRQMSRDKNKIAIWYEAVDFLIIIKEEKRIFKLITTFCPRAKKYKDNLRREYNQYCQDVAAGKAPPI